MLLERLRGDLFALVRSISPCDAISGRAKRGAGDWQRPHRALRSPERVRPRKIPFEDLETDGEAERTAMHAVPGHGTRATSTPPRAPRSELTRNLRDRTILERWE